MQQKFSSSMDAAVYDGSNFHFPKTVYCCNSTKVRFNCYVCIKNGLRNELRKRRLTAKLFLFRYESAITVKTLFNLWMQKIIVTMFYTIQLQLSTDYQQDYQSSCPLLNIDANHSQSSDAKLPICKQCWKLPRWRKLQLTTKYRLQ